MEMTTSSVKILQTEKNYSSLKKTKRGLLRLKLKSKFIIDFNIILTNLFSIN